MKNQNDSNEVGIWEWNVNGIPGLALNRASGRFYSRYRLHKKRTMVALKTDVLSVAKLRHLDRLAQAERQRLTVARGQG